MNKVLIFLFSILALCCSVNAGGSEHEFPFGFALIQKEDPSPPLVRGFMTTGNSPQKDYDDARSWGANVIRLQMHPVTYAMGINQNFWDAWPSYIDRLEEQLKRAKQAGLKVVVDLHEPPFENLESKRSDFWHQFQYPEFWNRSDLAEGFCRAWTEIATRLLPYRETIWGYDLYNEPVDRSSKGDAPPAQWRPLATKIIKAIRKTDKKVWIIYEPGQWGAFSGFKGLEPLPDAKVIYSAHFYQPHQFTHQGVNNVQGTALDEAMKQINITYPSTINGVEWDKKHFNEILKAADEFQAKWKVPIYVGEFSVIRWAPKEAAVRWLRDVVDLFESRGWSWTYHAFREFHGWSLEHDEKFWMKGMSRPKPVNYETDRARIIKEAFEKNWK